MPVEERPPEPWRSFLADFDELISEPVHLHCFGGFAVIHAYGVARTTNDCDFVSSIPYPLMKHVSELGGKGSELHKRHRVYLDPVTVATTPESYEDRLVPTWSWRSLNAILTATEMTFSGSHWPATLNQMFSGSGTKRNSVQICWRDKNGTIRR